PRPRISDRPRPCGGGSARARSSRPRRGGATAIIIGRSRAAERAPRRSPMVIRYCAVVGIVPRSTEKTPKSCSTTPHDDVVVRPPGASWTSPPASIHRSAAAGGPEVGRQTEARTQQSPPATRFMIVPWGSEVREVGDVDDALDLAVVLVVGHRDEGGRRPALARADVVDAAAAGADHVAVGVLHRDVEQIGHLLVGVVGHLDLDVDHAEAAGPALALRRLDRERLLLRLLGLLLGLL